jgi:aspartate ammonia-lyase
MATKEYRIERDSLGEVRVPKSAYYGAQTQRAVENFPISGVGFPPISSTHWVWSNMPRLPPMRLSAY